jgi:hypothetical protein
VNFILESFPESLFPPKNPEDYLKRILLGSTEAANSSVIFTGLARNVGKYLPNYWARLCKMGSMFRDWSVVVVENDSEDNTVEQLKYWPKTTLLTQNFGWDKLGAGKDENRREKLAQLRNCYLDYISQQVCDYVVVMDFDLAGGFSYEGLMHSMSYDFDMICSNGLLFRKEDCVFYDEWALRLDNLEDKDKNLFLKERGLDLIPVHSGFGGLAIYPHRVFVEGHYSKEDCDHVTFHQRLSEKGFSKFYLNPSMINIYSPTLYTVLGA